MEDSAQPNAVSSAAHESTRLKKESLTGLPQYAISEAPPTTSATQQPTTTASQPVSLTRPEMDLLDWVSGFVPDLSKQVVSSQSKL